MAKREVLIDIKVLLLARSETRRDELRLRIQIGILDFKRAQNKEEVQLSASKIK
jgi:hypothetical protein